MPGRFRFRRFKSAAEKFFSPGLGEQSDPSIAEETSPVPPPAALPPFPAAQSSPQTPTEGQLAIDVHHNPQEVVLIAPIAGVRQEDVEVTVTDDVLTIKGKRVRAEEVPPENLLVNECFWGNFSRSYTLPFQVVAEKAQAQIKDGVLIIRLPKADAVKTQVIKIKS